MRCDLQVFLPHADCSGFGQFGCYESTNCRWAIPRNLVFAVLGAVLCARRSEVHGSMQHFMPYPRETRHGVLRSPTMQPSFVQKSTTISRLASLKVRCVEGHLWLNSDLYFDLVLKNPGLSRPFFLLGGSDLISTYFGPVSPRVPDLFSPTYDPTFVSHQGSMDGTPNSLYYFLVMRMALRAG